VGWYKRRGGTLNTLTVSGVWLVTRPQRAALRRIKEMISAVINILSNRELGGGSSAEWSLMQCGWVRGWVDLRKSRRQ